MLKYVGGKKRISMPTKTVCRTRVVCAAYDSETSVAKSALIITDDHRGYINIRKRNYHCVIKHSAGIYADVDIHKNTIEGFWSLVKRSVIGIYHYISLKHLNRYLQEFTFRYNYKHEKPYSVTNAVLAQSIGKYLPYSELIGVIMSKDSFRVTKRI